MARRLTLAEQAERLADVIRQGADVSSLPQRLAKQLDRFERDLGLTRSFSSYSPRTRERYLMAARKGRTAREQREFEREQRRLREEQKRGENIESDSRWAEVIRLRDE